MDLSNQIQNAPAYNIPKALDPLRAWKVEVLRVDSVSGWDLVAGRLVIAFFFLKSFGLALIYQYAENEWDLQASDAHLSKMSSRL